MLHNYIPLGSVSPDRIIATVPEVRNKPETGLDGHCKGREGRSKSNPDGIHRVHATQHANRWARLSRRGNRQVGQMVTNILTNVFFFPHAHTCGAFFLFPLNGTTQQVVLFCFFLFAFVDVNGFEIGKYFPMAEKWPKKQRLTLHPSRRPTLEQWKMNPCWHTHTALGNLLSSDLGCFRATTHSPKKGRKKQLPDGFLGVGNSPCTSNPPQTAQRVRVCVYVCVTKADFCPSLPTVRGYMQGRTRLTLTFLYGGGGGHVFRSACWRKNIMERECMYVCVCVSSYGRRT